MFTGSAAEGPSGSVNHKSAMDRMYRLQRHIYDVTRAYYLLGRDRLIERLAPPHGGTVLEIGCGTGRNIVMAAQRYPNAIFFGIDISDEMLKSATRAVSRHKLAGRVRLAQADALAFDGHSLFGQSQFDRVYFSYTLSMIPDWQGAVAKAIRSLTPAGELHIVDFGQCEGLPRICRPVLLSWLQRFHVTPRELLRDSVSQLSEHAGRHVTFEPSHGGYAWHMRVFRP